MYAKVPAENKNSIAVGDDGDDVAEGKIVGGTAKNKKKKEEFKETIIRNELEIDVTMHEKAVDDKKDDDNDDVIEVAATPSADSTAEPTVVVQAIEDEKMDEN